MLPRINNRVKVPPIKIQGIKTKLVPFIFANTAWEGKGTYWEPFMGSGVVGLNLAPENAVFSDTNPHIINFYKAIQNKEINSVIVREYLEREAIKLAATPKDKQSYYYEVRKRFNKTKSSLDFLFLQRANFNGMMRFNSSGGYNVPFCRKPDRFKPALITKIVNQVKWVENKILRHPNWEFKIMPFEDALKKVSKDDFVYLDPPYIGRHDGYFDQWSQEKADLLAKLTQNSEAGYALSMWYSNKYRYNDHLDIWDKSEIITTEHFYHVGGKEANRNSVTEALVLNPKSIIQKNAHIKKYGQLSLDF